MNIQVQLPDSLVQAVQPQWGNLERRLLELTVIEAYRDGLISCGKLGELLGLETRWDTEAFLSERKVELLYDESDLKADCHTHEQLLSLRKIK